MDFIIFKIEHVSFIIYSKLLSIGNINLQNILKLFQTTQLFKDINITIKRNVQLMFNSNSFLTVTVISQ